MSLVSTNKIETNKYELEITADANSFEQAVEKAYLKARKKIKVNGFRNGCAPRKMIEKFVDAIFTGNIRFFSIILFYLPFFIRG